MTLNAEEWMAFNNLRVIRYAIEPILALSDAKANLCFAAGNYESWSSATAERTARKVASISC